MALWTVHRDGRLSHEDHHDGDLVRPNERVSWPLTIGLGVQHLTAMLGAVLLVPALTGFPVSTTLLFSGVGTLLFLVVTRNRVPAYLAPSYALIAPLAAARAQGLAAQLGGVLVVGLLLVVVGVAVKALGVRLLDSVMPPVVSGGIIVLIGLSLAPVGTGGMSRQPPLAAVTLVVICGCAVLASGRLAGLLSRLSVLIGVVVGWVAGAAYGALDPAKLAVLRQAAWVGLPALSEPVLRPAIVPYVLPAVLVLVAQGAGSVQAIGVLTGRDLNGTVGDTLIANGLTNMLAGTGGGVGFGLAPQNIGAMVISRVCSTAAYLVAALLAMLAAFSPKFVALIGTLPPGVIGAATVVLVGMVCLIGVRIWVDQRLDLRDPVNLVVIGVALVAGVGDLTFTIGVMAFHGIVWGSLVMVLGYPVLRAVRSFRDSAGSSTTPLAARNVRR